MRSVFFKTGVVAAAMNAGTGADNQRKTAMEADTISIHGRSSTSHKSRGNIKKWGLLFFSLFCLSVASLYAQAGSRVTIVNNTGYTALFLYCSPASDTGW